MPTGYFFVAGAADVSAATADEIMAGRNAAPAATAPESARKLRRDRAGEVTGFDIRERTEERSECSTPNLPRSTINHRQRGKIRTKPSPHEWRNTEHPGPLRDSPAL